MSRFMKKVSKKEGQAPGTLVFVGAEKDYEVKITVMDYDEKELREKEVTAFEECFPYRETNTVTWINIDGVHELDIIERIGQHCELHPLMLEDIVNTNQRPKIEDFGEYLFMVLKMLKYNKDDNTILNEQISLVLGSNFLFSFHESKGDVFDPVRERIRKCKGRIRKLGPDYLAYSLIDAVVDNYFTVLEKLGDRIEDLEEELIDEPTTKTLHSIYTLKKEMIFLRKSVWPLREVIASLERGDYELINEHTLPFLRDVYDHTIQVIDTVETFRDLIAGMLDTYLSSISNKMNSVMKVLTIIATIFIPLTFLAGIYGMNFEYMPELHWKWGYPVAALVMFSIGVTMLILFKRKSWL
ncbi:MAG TPA: magnesium/cobalt transporter CorA [archaeon]|nr:magnesium/cobalt transporter CorA [archaeon]